MRKDRKDVQEEEAASTPSEQTPAVDGILPETSEGKKRKKKSDLSKT